MEEGSWLLKPTPSWKGSVALMMVWATVSPFLQVSVPPQYLQHIYIIYNISTLSKTYLHHIYTVHSPVHAGHGGGGGGDAARGELSVVAAP